MKLKTLAVLLGSVVMLATTANVLAAAQQIICPDPTSIRAKGSNFKYANLSKDWTWALISEPFEYADEIWQTTVMVDLPNVMRSYQAIEQGTIEFSHAPMLNNPAAMGTELKKECIYTPAGMNVSIVARTPAIWSFKKK